MGGGDLNLKKSWHPSTMKNIEKVWKAEQQQNQEKKKIAELKKELEIEKDREDIKKYAMEQGVIEKTDDKKLDWMYKGPNQLVNREEYLLGRPIDKSFEQLAQAEKSTELSQTSRNHVEHECIPPSLRFFSGNEQVDLARKMQEDPLYAIKKKEMETRSQLLKNPVKLKQLRQLLEEQSKKGKSEKKQKKKKKHKHSVDSEETELDMLLAAKYRQLKEKVNDKDLLKSIKRIKRKEKKKKHDVSVESESSDEEDPSSKNIKKHKRKRSRSRENIETRKHGKDKHEVDRRESRKRNRSSSKESNDGSTHRKRNKAYKSDKDVRPRSPQSREHSVYKNKYNNKNYAENKYISSKLQAQKSYKEENQSNDKRSSKQSLTEEEKEKRRREMIENAMWRDKERELSVKKYREEEKKEVDSGKVYNQDFVRKHLAAAAEVGTVASRIKSNINNIQRSGRAMDTNFAKR